MLDASFIEKIVELGAVRGVEVSGRDYTTAKIYPNLEPEAAPLKMHTLSGLVDFCLELFSGTCYFVRDFLHFRMLVRIFVQVADFGHFQFG